MNVNCTDIVGRLNDNHAGRDCMNDGTSLRSNFGLTEADRAAHGHFVIETVFLSSPAITADQISNVVALGLEARTLYEAGNIRG